MRKTHADAHSKPLTCIVVRYIGGNFVRMWTVRDVRFVHCLEVRGVRISEVEMYGEHAVFGRVHAVCPL